MTAGSDRRIARPAALGVVSMLLATVAACNVPPTNTSSPGTGTPTAIGSASNSGPGTSSVSARAATPYPVGPLPTHAATGAATVPAALPVLGVPWSQHQQGYGEVQPTTIFNGGDPTGLVQQVRWSSWGGTSAAAAGTAEYVGPGQSVASGIAARADVVAFDLGFCSGRKVYRAVEWYFPEYGQHFSATRYLDACTGQDHGM